MRKIISLLVLLIVITTSCFVTKTNVGRYADLEGKPYTYAKGKQVTLFWGLIPMGYTDVRTPPDGNCQIITKFNFGDLLVDLITGGIVNIHTIKVKAKQKTEEVSPAPTISYHGFKIGDNVTWQYNDKTILHGTISNFNDDKTCFVFIEEYKRVVKLKYELITKITE